MDITTDLAVIKQPYKRMTTVLGEYCNMAFDSCEYAADRTMHCDVCMRMPVEVQYRCKTQLSVLCERCRKMRRCISSTTVTFDVLVTHMNEVRLELPRLLTRARDMFICIVGKLKRGHIVYTHDVLGYPFAWIL